MSRELDARLERHPLPGSMLSSPLFAGVEAPVLAFEVVVLVLVIHATGRRLLPIVLTALALFGLHVLLALATKKDRRLALVFSRSFAYPKAAIPSPTFSTRERRAEPSFPRKALA